MSELQVVVRPVGELRLDPANVRTHGVRNLAAIKGSLARFGQRKPVVVMADGLVVAGNGTLIAAQELGWESIACVTFPGTADEARAYAIADNRTGELAEWDSIGLLRQLTELDDELRYAAGYDDDELSNLIAFFGQPPSLDDLADEHGDPDESALWPLFQVRVPQSVIDDYRALVEGIEDGDEASRFAAVVEWAVAGQQIVGDESVAATG